VRICGAPEPDEAVIARLRDLIQGGDRTAILAPQALEDVTAVVAAAAAPGSAAGLARHGAGLVAAAELCGYRFRLLGEADSGAADLALMVALTAVADEAAPGALPSWQTAVVGNLARDAGLAVFCEPGTWSDIACDQPTLDDAALTLLRLAALALPAGDPVQGIVAVNLSGRLLRAYLRHGGIHLLREAAERCRSVLSGCLARGHVLANLALVLSEESGATGDPVLLDAAIEAGTAAAGEAQQDADRISAVANLGPMFRARAERTGSVADAGKAVDLARQAVAATEAADGALPGRLANLASALTQRYELTGDGADVTEAVAAARVASASAPADAADFVTVRIIAATALYSHHERTAEPSSLDEAIAAYRAALEALPDDEPRRSGVLSDLGTALHSRGQGSGDAAVLTEAVRYCREAVERTPSSHPDLAGRLANLAHARRSLAERTGSETALREAITAGRQAADAAPAGHPDHALAQSALGTALDFGAQVRGMPADLDEAIKAHREAVRTAAGQPRIRAAYQTNLSVALLTRAERTGSLADLQEALAAAEQAVRDTPPGHPMTGTRLTNLSLVHRALFERTGDDAALAAAISLAQQVVDLDSGDTALRAGWLSNLALALRVHLERKDDTDSLHRALAAARKAVEVAAADDPDRPGFVSNLSTVLYAGFERTGDRELLAEAIRTARTAVSGLPAGHPDRPGFLSNLGNALQASHDRGGPPADLDEAVEVSRQAVEMTPERHRERPRHMANLASTLRVRYEQTGARESLEEAISAATAAAAEVPSDDPQRAQVLQALCNVLLAHFELTGLPASLDRAVDAARSAAGSVPAGHPALPLMLSSLSNALAVQHAARSDLDSLDQAIAAGRNAVSDTPPGHPTRPARQANLSILLRTRHESLTDPQALGEAVAAARAAADTMPPGGPDHAVALFLLAEALAAAQPDLTEPGLLVPAINAYRDAALAPGASPAMQVRAAAEGGRLAAACGDMRTGLDLLDCAVSALENVAPLELNRPDQERRLAQFAGLASDAAACAAELGEPERAVLLLEQGRGILLAQILDARPDIAALRRRHPEQAARFEELLASLASDLSGAVGYQAGVSGIGAGRRAERRQADATELRRLTGQIREDPEFAGFRRRPELDSLLSTAASDPVVMIAASDIASYALAVTKAGVIPIPLPGLTAFAAGQHASTFHAAVAAAQDADASLRDRREAESAITQVLGWLWTAIAGPVLQHLDLDHPPPAPQPPPRLWWSAAGPLGLLPLHAATPAGQDPGPGVIDMVTSSYTPTIRALAHSRSRPAPHSERRVLAVCLPQTPGCPDLAGAADDLELLRNLFGGEIDTLTGPEANRAAVLTALPGHAVAHFACHARADIASPSDSGLLVYDHQDRALTVAQLIALDLPGADLAFLSACETARTGPALSDESVHLGAAFQVAGYRHVVATLWSSYDNPAMPVVDGREASISRRVYQAVRNTGSTDAVPAVLHDQTRRMRDEWPAKPSLWAVYAHFGA
jgi:tetratricopeptide (TPR) repeat protein